MQFGRLMPARRQTEAAALALFAALISLPSQVRAVPDPMAGSGGTFAASSAVEALPEAPRAAAVPRAPQYTLLADIDLSNQRMTVSAGGKVVNVYPISSGRAGHETPRGTFRPQWASKMHYSKKYDNAPMPHSVFFNGGIATHGTQAVGMLGRPASHGCIRLHPSAASAFYALVHKHGYASTRIVVRGTPPRHRGDEIASRRNRDAVRQQIVRRPVQPIYAYVQPAYGYRLYAQRPVYIVRQRGSNPNAGQFRYGPAVVRY